MLDSLDIGAIVGALSLIVVAVIERRTRKDEDKWIQNSREHEALVARVEDIGNNLGRSIDRVENNLVASIDVLGRKVERVDEVLVSHIEDHARGVFSGTN